MSSTNDQDTNEKDRERRQRFRIDDAAILEIAPATREETETRSADSFFVRSAGFLLVRELQEIDRDSQALLRSIGERNSDIALYLTAINKKIDCIGSAVAENILTDNQKLQAIDLSEGGIGFRHDQKLVEDNFYAMKIWFNKALIGISVFIRVVACNRSIDGGHHISAAFYNMADIERKTVARHIMQVQAALQRSNKAQLAANDGANR